MRDLIKDKEGRTIYLAPKKFHTDIIKEKACFICGKPLTKSSESKEHILPNWILRDFNMHDKEIELPNGEKHRYGTYTVPCCTTCNARMGKEIEEPISKAIKSGHNSVVDYAKTKNGSLNMYTWLARIWQ